MAANCGRRHRTCSPGGRESPTTRWVITILPTCGEPFGRTVEVPDTTATMDYTDLLDTDPTTLVPPALTLGELMRVHWAKSDDDAFEYSRAHPDELVLYQEAGA